MAYEDFDWTIVSSDAAGHLLWGVQCEVCGETTPLPDIDRLTREAQEVLFQKVADKHECKGS